MWEPEAGQYRGKRRMIRKSASSLPSGLLSGPEFSASWKLLPGYLPLFRDPVILSVSQKHLKNTQSTSILPAVSENNMTRETSYGQ